MGAKCRPHYREESGLLESGSRSFRRRFASLLTLFEPIALAVHFQDMDMMREPVEQRSGEAFGAKDLSPFVEREIAGDQRGAALVTLAEDLKQEFGNQQLVGGQLFLGAQEPLFIGCLHQFID